MRGHHFSDLFAVHLGLTGDFSTVMRESGAFWKLIPSGRQCSFVERRRADQVGSVSPQCDDGERGGGETRGGQRLGQEWEKAMGKGLGLVRVRKVESGCGGTTDTGEGLGGWR